MPGGFFMLRYWAMWKISSALSFASEKFLATGTALNNSSVMVLYHSHTHTHTQTHMYIYIYIYIKPNSLLHAVVHKFCHCWPARYKWKKCFIWKHIHVMAVTYTVRCTSSSSTQNVFFGSTDSIKSQETNKLPGRLIRKISDYKPN